LGFDRDIAGNRQSASSGPIDALCNLNCQVAADIQYSQNSPLFRDPFAGTFADAATPSSSYDDFASNLRRLAIFPPS
jgi:hypothetical protein